MTPQGAEKAITTSALIVAGIYAYRRVTEGSGSPSGSKAAQLLGQGSPPSVGVFITAWGTAFLIMSIMATVSPGLGGSFAIVTAVADVLSNGQQLATDINGKLGTTTTTSKTAASKTAASSSAAQTVVPAPTLTWTPTQTLSTIP